MLMKGILPVWCRLAGYALLILSVFVPLLMSMFGCVHDGNLLFVKVGMKLVIWVSLFMIFLSKARDENAETAHLRSQAMKYALGLWGIYYFVKLILSLLDGDIQAADNSTAIVYMVINVICQEFLLQKNRMDKIFHHKK